MATSNITILAGEIKNRHISNQSGDEIDASKLKHVHRPFTNCGTAIGGTPATREELVFVARNACVVKEFFCGLAIDGSSSSMTFDLKKNGTSILTSAVTVTHSTGDGVVVQGTLGASVNLSAGDRLSIALTVSSATGAQGPFAGAVVTETGEPSE